MNGYEIIWSGVVNKQIEIVTVVMEDLRTFTVQRVTACEDALLPPRDTNTGWKDREAMEPEKSPGRPRRAIAPLSRDVQAQILSRYRAGAAGGETIAKELGLSINTVKGYLWRHRQTVARQALLPLSEKPCSMCRGLKPIEDYGPDKANRDGRKSYCRSCNAEYHRERRERLSAARRVKGQAA